MRKPRERPSVFYLLLCAGALMTSLPAHARCPKLATETAVGYAGISKGDTGAARDRAISDALAKAVGRACGIKVEARTILEQAGMVEHTVVNKTEGFVRTYDILNEWKQDGAYRVEVEAVITGPLADEKARRFYRRFGVIAHLDAKVDGRGIEGRRATKRLRAILKEKGYEVVDGARIERLSGGGGLLRSAVDGSRQSMRTLAGRFLARILVLGKVEAQYSGKDEGESYDAFGKTGTHIYRATADIQVIDISKKEPLFSYSTPLDGVRGFGAGKPQAAQKAIDSVLARFEEKLLPELVKYTGNSTREIAVVVENVADRDDYDRFKSVLKGIRGVELVRAAEFRRGGSCRFIVKYRDQTDILTGTLERRLPGLVEKKSGWTHAVLRWKKP